MSGARVREQEPRLRKRSGFCFSNLLVRHGIFHRLLVKVVCEVAMKILPPEPAVELYKDGFGAFDVLLRTKVSKALSSLVGRIDDPVVIALDGRWGTGKSYFLKRWVGAHTIENGGSATTIYFDAFAHDYLSDPLPALVSALSERVPSSSAPRVDKLKKAAFKLVRPLARAGLAAATYGASEALSGAGDVIAESLGRDASISLDEFWKGEEGRIAAIQEFRTAISSLVNEGEDGSNPTGASLVIVIDELDRCRPDYALEVLEVIKHFFDVPGVQFVLGVNMKALENSVVARYGSGIDAEAYLRKFINIILNLPSDIGDTFAKEPASLVYLNHLMKEMGTPSHLVPIIREQFGMMVRRNEISIRDAGKIVSSFALINRDVLERTDFLKGYLEVMVTLVIARIVRPDLFPKFLDGTVGDSELMDFFGATIATVTERLNDEHNSEYDHRTYWTYMLWKYVVGDGRVEDSDEELIRLLARSFDSFGRLDDVRGIPRQIYRDWIDLFELHSN